MRKAHVRSDDRQADPAAGGPDAARLQDTDPGQDLCVGHQHKGELPDAGAGDVIAGGEAADNRRA